MFKDPPPVPKNLSCAVTFDPIKMLCQWDPGQETAKMSTTYTLHTTVRSLFLSILPTL